MALQVVFQCEKGQGGGLIKNEDAVVCPRSCVDNNHNFPNIDWPIRELSAERGRATGAVIVWNKYNTGNDLESREGKEVYVCVCVGIVGVYVSWLGERV